MADKTSKPWSLDYEFTLTKDSVISFGSGIDEEGGHIGEGGQVLPDFGEVEG